MENPSRDGQAAGGWRISWRWCSWPVVLAMGVQLLPACLVAASLTKQLSLRLQEAGHPGEEGAIALWASRASHHSIKLA